MKEYFKINVSQYAPGRDYEIVRPASLDFPKDYAVMFVTKEYMERAKALYACENCLVFWPDDTDVPEDLQSRHAFYRCPDAKKGYCSFFRDNHITYCPPEEPFDVIGGAFIAKSAVIGERCRILPGAYIGGEVEIGDDCYIGSGTRLVGEVHIGKRVTIRENAVIGADGFSTDRDSEGKALTMPQFGGVVIEDDVIIGALTLIERGAIDNTIIKHGVKLDNCVFIGHNNVIGEDAFLIGGAVLLGSVKIGNQAFIGGNSVIREGRAVGERSLVGMGAVVAKSVGSDLIVKGNPAK